MKQLSDIGEDALVKSIIEQLSIGSSSSSVIVGPGDDCAVIDVGLDDCFQLLKTDSIVEGVHYLESADPQQVGWKAVARVISDFAAMGGLPSQLLITIAMPSNTEVGYVECLYRGLNQCALEYGAMISGGETTTVPEGAATMISVAGTGWVRKSQYVTRAGGSVGDVVLVTGKLGGSIRGKHLNFKPRLHEAQWLVKHTSVTSMMDLSDGLAKDLPRMALSSGCGYSIEEQKIPINSGLSLEQALGDGEDYELLFTVARSSCVELLTKWAIAFPELKLTEIGCLTKETTGFSRLPGGWEHFSES
ncbi:MAG: thiamine-phosphate kinase [Akkermansiaceae bacterium]